MQPPPLIGILELRRYRPEDAKATMAIFYAATGQENRGGCSQKQVEEWVLDFPNRDSWVEGFEEWVTCVAEHDGHLIGFSTMMLDGFIAMLYVDPVYQHQNVEVALLTHVEKIALKRGITRLHAALNLSLSRVFTSAGFKIADRRTSVLRGCRITFFQVDKWLDRKPANDNAR